MANCRRCGANIIWVYDEDDERLALDPLPRYEGAYTLDPENSERAHKVERPGLSGYSAHDETCMAAQGGKK